VYKKNISMFGSDKAIGDFKFIRTVYEKNKGNIAWLDKLIARTQRAKEGSGLPE
jgi:hypothetical protein